MDTFLNPDTILDELEINDDIILKRDMVVADFGCGSGGFAIPLAERLDNGLVYAVDVQESSLSALKSQALLNNLNNIRFIRADLEKPKASNLQDSSIDLVLIVNTLFQIDDKNAIISESYMKIFEFLFLPAAALRRNIENINWLYSLNFFFSDFKKRRP